MGCNAACAKCTQKCLLVHGKKKSASSDVISFIKPMVGDDFDKVLWLPPNFAPNVLALVGQKVFLEDSRGMRWEVTLSRIDGSLGFQQGWTTFFSAHGIHYGDYVVFHYIMSSHFIVQIFGTSACEKLSFPETTNPRKRMRDNLNFTIKENLYHTIDKPLMNKQGSKSSKTFFVSGSDDMEKTPIVTENAPNGDNSNERSKSTPKEEYIEEMVMIGRDLGDKQAEERTCIFDLSNFEMLKNKSGSDGSNKSAAMDQTCSHHADSSLGLRNEAGLVDKNPVIKELEAKAISSDTPEFNFERIVKNNCSEGNVKEASISDKDSCTEKTPGDLFPTPDVNPDENENISANREINQCVIADGSESQSGNDQVVVSQKEHNLINDSCQRANEEFTGNAGPITVGTQNFDKMMKIVKEEPVEITPDPWCQEIKPEINGESFKVVNRVRFQSSNVIIREYDRVASVVKIEPVDPVESLPSSSKISCLVAAGSQSFLELPENLPLPLYTKGRPYMDSRVVFLQDPENRLWPVLYTKRSIFRVLTSGWEAFSKASNIKPGDECVFGVENPSEGICSVNIIRR